MLRNGGNMSKIICYVGSYSKPEEVGIHSYEIDTESLEYKEMYQANGIADPSYLCVDQKRGKLYSVMESFETDGEAGGALVSFSIEEAGLVKETQINIKGTLPCHIIQHKETGCLFTANYWSGNATMCSLNENKNATVLSDMVQHHGTGPNAERQEGPHAHFCGFSRDEDMLWVVDLGLDTVKCYDLDMENKLMIEKPEQDVALPKGVGPRHFVWNKDIDGLMYVVCELSSEVFVVDTKKQNKIIQSISTLPEGVTESACAAIRLSEDGKFLYVSNRGHDSIVVYRVKEDGSLDIVEITSVIGKTPRDFNLIEDLLLVANQDSDEIQILKVDRESGKLKDTGKAILCKKPSCIAF